MEELKRELELGELKRENLRKSFEQANAQVSSILVFSFQWKELENHFDLVQQNIQKRLAVLKSREKELETTNRILRERQEGIGVKDSELSMLSKKIEECESELSMLSKKIEECKVDHKFKEQENNWMQELLQDCSSEFKSKSEELDLVRKSVQDCSEELSLKKEQLCSVQKLISECCEKLEGKGKQLNLVEEQIRKSSDKVDASKQELERLGNSIEECSNQLDMKQNELFRNQEMIKNQCKQLNLNEKKLESIKSLIQDYEEELEAKKEKYEALEKAVRVHAAKLDYKEKELGSIDEKISDRLQKLHSRNDELDSLLKLIRRTEKQLKSTKEELDSKENSIRGYSENIELKNQEFNAMQMSIEERTQELHSKEKQLSSVQISVEGCTKRLEVKEGDLTSIKDSILECTKELGSKQQQLEAARKSQEEISGMIECKEKQLHLFEEACGERLQEANAKEKHLSSLERSLEERLEKLEKEKRQFEARVKEFELREKQFASVQKAVEQRSNELESREKELTNALHSQVSSEKPSSFFFQALGITNTESVNPVIPNQIKREIPEDVIFNANETSSSDLQSILNRHSNKPDLRKNEVLSILQMSPDPAKFVLDVMLGISSQYKKKGGTGFEQSVLEMSLLMLEELFQVSPHVQPKVKADALNFANEWKAKMKLNAGSSIEILGFLQFVAAFGLVSSFNREEIFKLLGTTAQHQQARNICKVLGFTDKIPEFVDSLIARKQYIEAVRFVCAFDCKDKCPPEKLLNLFLDDTTRVARDRCMIGKNSHEVQKKATDEQIVALKSVIECVKDCKLESCVPVEIIENWIAELEKVKKNIKFSATASAPVPAVQPNVQGWTTCNTSPSVPGTPGTQPQGMTNKRARASGLVISSYTPKVATGSIPNIRAASPHGLGVPRNQGVTHFGSAANKEHSSIHNRPKQQ